MDYYPGSSAKREAFLRDFPDADLIASPGPKDESGAPACPPWALRTGLTEATVRGRIENWTGVMQEVRPLLLHCTALHCTTLHCTALHCNVLRCLS